LSDFNLKLAQPSEPQLLKASELSQQFEDQILVKNTDSQQSQDDLQPITPDMSTQAKKPAFSKKKKKKKKENA